MSFDSDDLARRAAQRLGAELEPRLPGAVEAKLRAGGEPPERFEPVSLAVSLATLVISAAKLGWDVYRDLTKDKKAAPAADVVARQLRIKLELGEGVSTEQRDMVIAVVVDELAKRPPES
jgi:hypothetical protein